MKSQQNKTYRVKKLKFDDIDQSFKKEWVDLVSRSISHNVYLDPNFVLSAEENLGKSNMIIRAVYRTDLEKPLLVGLGLFTFRLGDKRMPYPHLQAYQTEHSFLSDLLIDTEDAENIMQVLFKHLAKEFWYLAGLRMADFAVNDAIGKCTLNIPSLNWHEFWGYERAVLQLPETVDDTWSKDISRKRLKNYRKARRELEELGTVEWHYYSEGEINQPLIDNFLQIEHSGWKGEQGTSLFSKSNHVEFFNSLVTRFNHEGQIFFTELTLNNEVIAATCNLISNKWAHAFKIGWDIDYKKYSAGVINEIEFLQYADQSKCNFNTIESGATEDSFINSYWKQRWYLAEGIYSYNAFSRTINLSNDWIRLKIKNLLRLIREIIDKHKQKQDQ